MKQMLFTNGTETKTAEELQLIKKGCRIIRFMDDATLKCLWFTTEYYITSCFEAEFPGWSLVEETKIKDCKHSDNILLNAYVHHGENKWKKWCKSCGAFFDGFEWFIPEKAVSSKMEPTEAEPIEVIPSNIVNFVDAEFDTLESEFDAKIEKLEKQIKIIDLENEIKESAWNMLIAEFYTLGQQVKELEKLILSVKDEIHTESADIKRKAKLADDILEEKLTKQVEECKMEDECTAKSIIVVDDWVKKEITILKERDVVLKTHVEKLEKRLDEIEKPSEFKPLFPDDLFDDEPEPEVETEPKNCNYCRFNETCRHQNIMNSYTLCFESIDKPESEE